MNQPRPLAATRVRADLLEPRDLAALGGIEFVARHIVEGFIAGLHRSPHRGFSVEFAEHRMYQPGDDLRHIDWRVFAKQLAASIALLLLRQGDTVGLVAFDHEIRSRLVPRGGRRHWYELTRTLADATGSGRTDASPALRDVAVRLRRRGLVILLSDLLVDAAATRIALRFLRHVGHEVLVFHVIDPGERELPGIGDARFVDPESGEEVPINVADLRAEYRRAVADAILEWRDFLVPHAIDYVVVDTDQPMALGLRAYLRKRERLG
jgi:uncharacterized protein (DUF58 family)